MATRLRDAGAPRRDRAHLRPPAGAARLGAPRLSRLRRQRPLDRRCRSPASPSLLFATTSFYFDLNASRHFLRLLFFRRASQNVVSRGENPDATHKLILAAHVDAARTGTIFGKGATRSRSASPASCPSPTPASSSGPPRSSSPCSALAWPASTRTVSRSSRSSPRSSSSSAPFSSSTGASPRSSRARTTTHPESPSPCPWRRSFEEEPPRNLDVWVVLTGGEECGLEGMRSFARAHKDELDPFKTIVLAIDSVGKGDVRWVTSEGMTISFEMDARVDQLCEAIAEADSTRTEPLPRRGAPPRLHAPTPSPPASPACARAPSPASNPARSPPPTTTLPQDVPDAIDPEALDRADELHPRPHPRPRPRPRPHPPARARGSRRAREAARARGAGAHEREALGALGRGGRGLEHDRVHALARSRARPQLRRRLQPPLGMVRRRRRDLLALDLGLLRGRRRRRLLDRPRKPRHARRRVVPRHQPQLRRAHLPRQGPGEARHPARGRGRATSPRSPGASCPSASPHSPPACARSASSAAIASPPTSRTAPKRSSASSPPPRSAPSGRPARPTSAPARSSTASPRSSPRSSSPLTATPTAASRFDRMDIVRGLEAEMPSLAHTVLVPYLDPDADPSAPRARHRLERRRRQGRRRDARVRPRPLRPPPVGPLLLGHHRPAQGHRPGPRRHPPRAPEEDAPPRRRAGRRPHLLVHHHRLDDVELPRLDAPHRRVDRPLRRQPRPPRRSTPSGTSRRRPRSPPSAPRRASSPPA